MRAAVVLISLSVFTLACSEVGTQLAETPLMFDDEIEEELRRVQKANQTIDMSTIDLEAYSETLGIDARNAKVVLEFFVCWEICPKGGELYLLYEDVDTKQDCVFAGGRILTEPTSNAPGVYVGCRPSHG